MNLVKKILPVGNLKIMIITIELANGILCKRKKNTKRGIWNYYVV
jgi:hypothetical protein